MAMPTPTDPCSVVAESNVDKEKKKDKIGCAKNLTVL